MSTNPINRKKLFWLVCFIIWVVSSIIYFPEIQKKYDRSNAKFNDEQRSKAYWEFQECVKEKEISAGKSLLMRFGKGPCNEEVTKQCKQQRCYNREIMIFGCMQAKVPGCNPASSYESLQASAKKYKQNRIKYYFGSRYSYPLYSYLFFLFLSPLTIYFAYKGIPKFIRWLRV